MLRLCINYDQYCCTLLKVVETARVLTNSYGRLRAPPSRQRLTSTTLFWGSILPALAAPVPALRNMSEGHCNHSRFEVASVVAFYMAAALVMVFVNKVTLNIIRLRTVLFLLTRA